MRAVQIYFSDFFEVDPDVIVDYGAVDISLINDMPLFIDPFLLFNSESPAYQAIHTKMITYLRFLQEESEKYEKMPEGMMSAWYLFSEVKQTWIGFSTDGNGGRGLGRDFAENLYRGLSSIFKSFGKETITKATHMEKLCLISPRVLCEIQRRA